MYMHLSRMIEPAMFALSCMCASFPRVSRVLTPHYDTALRPVGLRATQFTLLPALSLAGEVSQRTLGEIPAIDSTTFARPLAIVAPRGWIASRSGEDRRQRWLSLSEAGRAEFKRARKKCSRAACAARQQALERTSKPNQPSDRSGHT
jgi:DNA-binding MarR family transcriptional regulator